MANDNNNNSLAHNRTFQNERVFVAPLEQIRSHTSNRMHVNAYTAIIAIIISPFYSILPIGGEINFAERDIVFLQK